MSYLTDFLFSPERANSPVRTLSGGERNRVLLARLLALPANVLVLDEPTNDLDIDTLELLEELLQSYAGTVFLVSHDRRFLDNVVTSTIAWEGDDVARAAGASTRAATRTGRCSASARARRWRCRPRSARAAAPKPAPQRARRRRRPRRRKPRKLSYKEQRELDALPARIEALEAEQKELAALLAQRRASTPTDPARVEAGADALRADRRRAARGARALGGARGALR